MSLVLIAVSLFVSSLMGCTSTRHPQDNQLESQKEGEALVSNLVRPQQEQWLKNSCVATEPGGLNFLLIFGDSLSDTGRLHRRTKFFLPPSVYWQSRASNGPIWVDYVIGALNWKLANYAVAGARTTADSWFIGLFVASLQQQIDSFVEDQPSPAPDKTLAVIWIGPNNYLSGDDGKNVTETVHDLEQAVLRLRKSGLKYIMLGTMPELSGLPMNLRKSARSLDARLKAESREHNAKLQNLIANLRRRDPEGNFTVFQAAAINQQTLERPAAFGFRNMTEACYQGDFLGNFSEAKVFCTDPSGQKFWDGLHPNSKMHCYYAAQFLADVSEAGILGGYYDKTQALARCRKL